MRRQILITQCKPGVVTEPAELLQNSKGIALDAPTLLRVAHARQRVDNRVDVRRDMQAVKKAVVTGVADDRQLRGIDFRGQPFDQFGAAGAAGQYDNHEENLGVDGAMESQSGGKVLRGPPSLTRPSGPASRCTEERTARGRNSSPRCMNS